MRRLFNARSKLRGAVIVLVVCAFTTVPELFAFNPQPEPPANDKLAPAVQTPHDAKALGPQPEPPDRSKPSVRKDMEPLDAPDPGKKSLGPQPEPPDKPDAGAESLGPQPEPPDRERQVR
jgi:hypothetical protein